MNKTRKYEMRVGENDITYTLRRSKRARNLLLHVDHTGGVELVLPWRVSLKEGERFVEYKRDWIIQQIQLQQKRHLPVRKISLANGALLPVFGKHVKLSVEINPGRKKSFVKEENSLLIIKAPHASAVRDKVMQWYKREAQQYFEEKVSHYYTSTPVTVRINAAKTQWGSCNKKKRTLAFNWRLALVPEEIALYVLVHEVAHLTHANHSKSFWKLVAHLDPAYKEKKMWLRQRGHTIVL